MKRYVSPNCAWRSSSRLMICAWIETSSADTGSSQTMKLRLDGQRARDADALALAARELVRIAVRVARQEPDVAQQLAARARRRSRAVRHDAVDVQRLADDLPDRHARIERQ